MLIKRKNSRAIDLSDPLRHLEDILFPALDPLKTVETEANLTVLETDIDKIQIHSEKLQSSINESLSQQAELRKKNQLVYGKSLSNSNLVGLGRGLVDNPSKSDCVFYKEKMKSTNTYVYHDDQYVFNGIVEFGVTYDNKIFIVPQFDGVIVTNLYKMLQGTLLKAVGCLQIGNKEVEESVEGIDVAYSKLLEGQVNYISVYNSFFDTPKDNIAVSLFALKQLGVDLNDTQVVVPNDETPLISRSSGCKIRVHGNLENASYYLNENRFPGAKALAEKKSNFSDKIFELFCAIDDEILSKRNKKLIKDSYGEKELLKLSLIKLFSCTEALKHASENKSKPIEQPGLSKDINQPSTSSQAIAGQCLYSISPKEGVIGTFNDCWQAIKASLQLFEEKNIDLSFLTTEINMIVAYLLQNNLTSEENDQLKEWAIPGRIPGRGLDPESTSDYIKFYQRDPIKTCLALLQDYSKGYGWQGMVCRFFSGAWKRNYKDPVNKFLMIYHNNELPDNINICGIYQGLKDSGLIFNYDAETKSSLRKILLFCAKLNNEEDLLLHSILNLSYTSFPSIDSDSCGRCIERCC